MQKQFGSIRNWQRCTVAAACAYHSKGEWDKAVSDLTAAIAM